MIVKLRVIFRNLRLKLYQLPDGLLLLLLLVGVFELVLVGQVHLVLRLPRQPIVQLLLTRPLARAH